MKISIIIPALNEAKGIAPLLAHLRAHSSAENIQEILVVDGGSSDSTETLAQKAGAKVISSPKGRARQMNAGAHSAAGPIFYFLHADSYPPANFDEHILKAVSEGKPAGCFRLKFDQRHPLLNFSAWCTRFDMAAVRFGDQSLFVEKQIFEKSRGFKEELIVMEDNEIITRLKEQGSFTILPEPVLTSARKYLKNGVWRLQFLFTLIYFGFHLGVSQEKLVRFYKRNISS